MATSFGARFALTFLGSGILGTSGSERSRTGISSASGSSTRSGDGERSGTGALYAALQASERMASRYEILLSAANFLIKDTQRFDACGFTSIYYEKRFFNMFNVFLNKIN